MKYLDSVYEYDITEYSHKRLIIENLYKCYIFITPNDNHILKVAISRRCAYNKLQIQVREMPFDVFEIVQSSSPITSLDDAYRQYEQLIKDTVISINSVHSSLLTHYHLAIDDELKVLEGGITKDKFQESEYCNGSIEYYIKVEWNGKYWYLDNNRNSEIISFNQFSTAESVVKYICRLNNRVINILKTKLK